MTRNLSIRAIEEVMLEAYEKFRHEPGGSNASYIPYLQSIPNDLFGISMCFPNGKILSVGDTDYSFGIESISKVLTTILVLQQYNDETLLEKIGADATGLPFNSIMAILLENNHPSTPLVNAGAISACSLIQPIGGRDEKWEKILRNMELLCGSPLHLIEELYSSESETNYNNRSITWLLKNVGRIYDDPEMALDLYTKQCSLGVTCEQLAICGATIANGGWNSVTNRLIFDSNIATRIISLIATFGFYEKTGEWIYSTGLPVKTGVGGGIMGVLPGVFGIAAFAPPIDESGNSVKSQMAIKYIMNKLGLHIYNREKINIID